MIDAAKLDEIEREAADRAAGRRDRGMLIDGVWVHQLCVAAREAITLRALIDTSSRPLTTIAWQATDDAMRGVFLSEPPTGEHSGYRELVDRAEAGALVAAYRALIEAHNAKCEADCAERQDMLRAALVARGARSPDCARGHLIELPGDAKEAKRG